jgi:hypothetical protein
MVKVLECGVYELCRRTEAGLVWQIINTTILRLSAKMSDYETTCARMGCGE